MRASAPRAPHCTHAPGMDCGVWNMDCDTPSVPWRGVVSQPWPCALPKGPATTDAAANAVAAEMASGSEDRVVPPWSSCITASELMWILKDRGWCWDPIPAPSPAAFHVVCVGEPGSSSGACDAPRGSSGS